MQISIACVGRLREKYWTDAVAEYVKRLGGTGSVRIAEVADEPTPDAASPAQEDAVRRAEGERLLAKISPRDHVIVLDRLGRSLTSEAFAAYLDRAATDGASAFTFVIGGSLGVSDAVRERANLVLSFGALTFPHQLMRVVLLEQVYRAVKINRGEPYHK